MLILSTDFNLLLPCIMNLFVLITYSLIKLVDKTTNQIIKKREIKLNEKYINRVKIILLLIQISCNKIFSNEIDKIIQQNKLCEK